MKRYGRSVILVVGVIIGIWSGGSEANATWPSGARRTIPSYVCTAETFHECDPYCDYYTSECPYMSDQTHAAGDVVKAYADFDVTWDGADPTEYALHPCRQSYTGSAVACASGADLNSSLGNHHSSVGVFSSISGTASPWDYYYYTTYRGDTLVTLWGISYGDNN